MSAKIFLYDIETSPITAYTWSLWTEARSYENIVSDWCLLSWAGKWLGEDDVYLATNDYRDPGNDDEIICSLYDFIDEADIVVAHNGNRFDIKKMNTRFLAAELPPPSPYKRVDTLLEARKNFAFSSNRLDALGEYLGVGRKKQNDGFKLWTRCMAGDKKAFEEMGEYNVQDVQLLEQVYLTLRPWMQNHPNVGVHEEGGEPSCPKCGSHELHWRGYAATQTTRYHKFQCQSCGGWGRQRLSSLKAEEKEHIMVNVT